MIRAVPKGRRPRPIRAAAVAISWSTRSGFSRYSTAWPSIASVVTGACALITTTGRPGATVRTAPSSSRPVMPGRSRSVSSRSQCSAAASRSATTGSAVWVTSNRARLASTCTANRAASGSSSTTRIRPRVPSVLLVLMWPLCTSWLPARVAAPVQGSCDLVRRHVPVAEPADRLDRGARLPAPWPSLRRSRMTPNFTRSGPTPNGSFQASLSSWSRLRVWPGCRISAASRRNSIGVSATGVPPALTSRTLSLTSRRPSS